MPSIRGKRRRKLYNLNEHVLSKTKTAHINRSRLISVLYSKTKTKPKRVVICKQLFPAGIAC